MKLSVLGKGVQTTVYHEGSSSINVQSSGYDSVRVTCIFKIRLDGEKLPLFMITKGKKDQIKRLSGVYIIKREKSSCTQTVIRKWIDFMLPLLLRDRSRVCWFEIRPVNTSLKIWKAFFWEVYWSNYDSGWKTGYLQKLDIVINNPFKGYLRAEINDCFENRMVRNHRGNFVKPGLEEVASWIKSSLDKIDESCVYNAIRTGFLDKNYSFNDYYIARHGRFGAMIQREINLM